MDYQKQLTTILKASGWSQEQLARQLGVSFAALNAWLNGRSRPRQKALRNIQKLYLDTVGVDSVDEAALQGAKVAALAHSISPKALLQNREMLDRLTLYLTYHTNTIEGSTMTLSDVEEVIFEHKVLTNRTAIEQAEARNHQAALHWLVERLAQEGKDFRIDEALILGIHLRLMNGIVGDAGQYRQHAVRIMGTRVVLANWVKVPGLITRLTTAFETPSEDIVGDLAETHARFEQIHPFSDGNGRTGRLLLLAQALRSNLFPPLVLKERKYAYYKYLELAQTKEDYKPLELFMAESIGCSYELLGGKHDENRADA